MNAELRGEPGGKRLNTWKEIAGFFGCDERTVRRWEASRRLPVRRLPNGPRSAVFAYEDELRAWLNTSGAAEDIGAKDAAPVSPAHSVSAFARPRVVGLAIIGVAMAVFAGVAVWRIAYSPPDHTAAVTPAHAARHVPNAEAQALYRAGLYAWQTRTPAGLTQAVDNFTQAIVHDPQYAEAYAGLANCYNLLREYTTMAPDYAFARAKAAAERAIALDPSLGDAHAALAFADFYWLRDVTGARREFARALALSPGNATTHHWYATFLMTGGEFSRALDEIDKAEALDSESSAIRADKGMILFYAGQSDAAVALLRQLEETQPVFASPHHYLAIIESARGNDAAFLRELSAFAAARHDDADRATAEAGAKGLAAGGHAGMLQAMLATQTRLLQEGAISNYALAQTCADLGRQEDAIHYLRASLAHREADDVDIRIEPAFAPLHANAAFRTLVSENFAGGRRVY
jgi:Tfp pilus assembly protein PilF